jgi:hypothetical protein
MTDIEGPFFRAAADGVLLEEFRAISETNRYPDHPVLVWLVRFIVGSGGGPNKDSPLFELCHLVFAVDALTGNGNLDGRTLFFLGVERAIPRVIRPHLDTLAIASDSCPARLEESGIVIEYEGGPFQVKFGRMPFLIALYEFLVSMEGFTFYDELSDIFDGIADSARHVSVRTIKDATNNIASVLRQYRRTHMEWSANNEKFDRILPFLQERDEGNDLTIDDAAILDFWTLHSHGKEFKGYKTVFDAFVTFQRALQVGNRTQATQQASVMGTDRAAGEVDLADQAYDLGAFGEWTSPFQVLDEDEVKEIKFFKGAGERKPLEALMLYGPDAVRLPHAFMRLDCFAPIQTGITNDLQVKRGRESIERRVSCVDAEPYAERRDLYVRLKEHVQNLVKAALHGVLETNGDVSDNVVAFPGGGDVAADIEVDFDAMAEDAYDAFRRLTRKGFEDITDPNDERGDAFRRAAGALVTMAHILQGMLDAAERMDNTPPDLNIMFEQDRSAFSSQFARIYGERS